jgi:exopolyphosphatase/guanosine-5'-triphosphate,3'-diphosphate pyrophosphatase
MVGGSWRALARLEMAILDHPLPITHQHAMEVTKPRMLRSALQRLDKEAVRNIPSVPLYRLPTLPLAAQLLEALVEALRPNALVVSSFGIREGLLYDELDAKTRSLDPLVEAAREAGAGLGRFEQHGALLDAWIAPLFEDSPREARLRLAACLLADIAWPRIRFPCRARRRHGAARQLRIDARAGDAGPGIAPPPRGGRELPYPDVAALCTPEN